MPDAEFYCELPRRLPTVLHEPVEGGRDPWSLWLRADFGVLVEVSESSIADRHSSRIRVARVNEAELAALIDGCGRCGSRQLNAVVLTGPLDDDSSLHGVFSPSLRHAVRPDV